MDFNIESRLGGYGILPYPRSHQTIFPQKPTQPNHLCASVKSVGGSSTPEASVYSVNSVGEPYVATKLSSPQNSRNTETTGGEYPPTDCTDVHRLGEYGIPAIPTQPPNYLPTEFTEHTETTGGEEKSVYICEICGRLFSARSFCVFCEFRGRISSARNFCEFCGRTCASKLRVGSVEGIQRAAWVWQECHTLLLL